MFNSLFSTLWQTEYNVQLLCYPFSYDIGSPFKSVKAICFTNVFKQVLGHFLVKLENRRTLNECHFTDQYDPLRGYGHLHCLSCYEQLPLGNDLKLLGINYLNKKIEISKLILDYETLFLEVQYSLWHKKKQTASNLR